MSESKPDIPDSVAFAVDVMVSRVGTDQAETELQERFNNEDDQDRTVAAIAYLRKEYSGVDD